MKNLFFFFSAYLVIIVPHDSFASDFPIHQNPQSYVLNKFQSYDIVFLGTRHKQTPILNFVSELITALPNSGVTHIGLEIASDQQGIIDRFMKTGAGLNNIQLHSQIDCPEYRHLFSLIRSLDPDKRPKPVALDLPKSKYGDNISRDEWMAGWIAEVFKSNPNAKMLVIVGNNHVLKKLDWRETVINRHRSIREYLSEKRRKLRMVSIGQVIENSVYEDDFAERFGPIKGAVALDLDERYAGWKLGITQSMAIKPAEVWELLDGVVIY
jgi:hypothetical protein